MRLNNNIHRIVRRVLNEELGINPIVAKATDDVINQIVSKSEDEMFIKYPNEKRHYTNKAFSFDYELANGVTVRIGTGIVDFKDYDEYTEFKTNYPKEYRILTSGKTSRNLGPLRIGVTVIRVGGQVIPENYEILQHEIEHAFQRIMKNGSLSKNKKKYNKYTDAMRKSADPLIRKVGRVNYLSYHYEQDAFANGLYAFLKHSNCDISNIDDIIKSSFFYKTLNEMRRAVSFWESKLGDEETEAILRENFDYGVDIVLKRAKKVVNEFVKRLGRIKTLYLQELAKNEIK